MGQVLRPWKPAASVQQPRRALVGALAGIAYALVGLTFYVVASSSPAAAITSETHRAIPSSIGSQIFVDDTTGNPADGISIDVDVPNVLGESTDANGEPDQSILIILAVTVLAVAPSLLMLLTGFTRIVVVLSLARNALGLQTIPPNQVIAGLALFLSLFAMYPTASTVYEQAVKPLTAGEISQQQAYERAIGPIRKFMLRQTRNDDLAMFVKARKERPASRDNIGLSVLIPAFVLSELKTAFIIGFVIFIPFLVIDLIVSSTLMSMGMFMLPPILISLPFKLLLFVMVDGWSLVSELLVTSFR
jgi:flagellar biosynthetic protein FliP